MAPRMNDKFRVITKGEHFVTLNNQIVEYGYPVGKADKGYVASTPKSVVRFGVGSASNIVEFTVLDSELKPV